MIVNDYRGISRVNWMFLLSMLISKLIVFVLVIVFTLLLTRPMDWAKAGLFAIFCTQSNDFALGYPIGLLHFLSFYSDYVRIVTLLRLGMLITQTLNSCATTKKKWKVWMDVWVWIITSIRLESIVVMKVNRPDNQSNLLIRTLSLSLGTSHATSHLFLFFSSKKKKKKKKKKKNSFA